MIPDDQKRQLNLVGITYNQIESGVYAVILEEAQGTRRIPIIIGFPEAQSIECKLQEIITPRPLTHDLMVNMMENAGIILKEVQIYKLPNGVFAAELQLEHDGMPILLDSRSSDAIALAIRLNAPIYTSASVIEEAGFEPGDQNSRNAAAKKTRRRSTAASQAKKAKSRETGEFDHMTLSDLQAEMQRCAEAEDYEKAARIKLEIDRRIADENYVDPEPDLPF